MIVTPVLCSDFVDRFQQRLHIQVGIHPLRQRHGTGVAYDLFDHGRFHLSLRQHRDTGVPGELVVITLVGISVLVPLDIHILGVILVADVIFHSVLVQLVEQALQFLQRG